MPVTLGQVPEAVSKDGWKMYWESYAATPKKFDQLYKVRKDFEGLYTKTTSAVGTGLLQEKPEGDKKAKVQPIQGFTVYGRVRTWAKQESITKEVHDNATKMGNFLKSQMPQWGQDSIETMEDFYAKLFDYGGYTAGHRYFNASITQAPNILEDPSGDFIFDGKPLFTLLGNDRTAKNGSTYHNGLALAPTLPNLQSAWNLMTNTNNKREDGQEFDNAPTLIVAKPSLKFTIDQLVKSPDDPSTSNRAINVARDLVQPFYWSKLGSSTQWTLMKPKVGMVALVGANPEFKFWQDHETDDFFMSISMTFGVEIKDWRPFVSSNFATA